MSAVHVAAVDLGASSGRVVLGEVGPGRLRVEPVARFANDPVRLPDGLHWNVLELYRRSLEGLATAARHARRAGEGLASVGVDSWAVDYALMRGGRMLGVPFHYRDEARSGGVDLVHAHTPPEELYARHGLQFLPFNTLYQLAADPWTSYADRLLMVPDLLHFWLTGREANERTNASTTGLLDWRRGQWDLDLLHRLGLPGGIFASLVSPGEEVGQVLPQVRDALGVDALTVVAAATHDTASAVVAVPMQTDDAAYISCGTWGLVGVELETPRVTEAARLANFTHEGGVDGRIRFLTNVMGTWLLSETLRTWARQGQDIALSDALAAAEPVEEAPVFDVQDPRFLPPGDMPARIAAWFEERGRAAPEGRGVLVRSILESLAQAFAEALETAQELSGHRIRVVHMVGGGALNRLLCQAVADRSGRTVLAGPVEATALGNVLVQGRAAGAVSGDLESLRRLVADTHDLPRFTPCPAGARWGV